MFLKDNDNRKNSGTPVCCCSWSSVGSVNSTKITNSASLIFQAGFLFCSFLFVVVVVVVHSFVKCNFAVDLSVSIMVFMFVKPRFEKKNKNRKQNKNIYNIFSVTEEKKINCVKVCGVQSKQTKKKPVLHDDDDDVN